MQFFHNKNLFPNVDCQISVDLSHSFQSLGSVEWSEEAIKYKPEIAVLIRRQYSVCYPTEKQEIKAEIGLETKVFL